MAKVCNEIVPTKRNAELIKVLVLQEQLIMLALYNLFKDGDSLNIEVGQLVKECKWVTESISMAALNEDIIKQRLEML